MSTKRLYVGRLSYRTRERDLEDAFSKYGKIVRCDVKQGYAFVEFEDERDAEDAISGLDGTEVDGARIVVEASKGGRDRSGGDRREGGGRGGGGRDECYGCGGTGHWARDCPSSRGGRGGGRGGRDRDGGDRDRGACYKCGERGHIARDCSGGGGGGGGGRDSYGSYRRSRSRSRSRSPRRNDSPRRDRSRSRDKSPAPAGDRRSPDGGGSPARSPANN